MGSKENRRLLGVPLTYLNIALLSYCAFCIVGFAWDVLIVRQQPFMFSASLAIGFLCGVVGMLLYANGRQILGLTCICGQIGDYIVNNEVFHKSLVKNLFFWVFLCLFFVLLSSYVVQIARGRIYKTKR
jgi:hypothetical protein